MQKVKAGNITIILVVLLCLSFGVLALSKFFDSSQASVSTALDSRFQNPAVTLSVSMDPPAKWEKYENTKYGYAVKYPKQWPASNSKLQPGDLDTYTRFLSKRVTLVVGVTNKHANSEGEKQISINKNTFFYKKEQENERGATVRHNNLYYTLKLSHDNYFADKAQFDNTFFNILKGFDPQID